MGKNDWLLMKALSEVVRMGEGTWADRGSNDMGSSEMWSGKVTWKSPAKVTGKGTAKVTGKGPEKVSEKNSAATPMKKKRSMRNIFEEL